MKDSNRILYLFLLVLAILVNFSGINVNFFTDDPGLYASIAKNLLHRDSFFELFTYNQDWLDKPHFPFWCILLSFKLFGVSVWAYRLPALLFFVLSLFYTFLFTRKYYGTETGMFAALILATALHVQLSNTDVRAETYLMALIMGAIYHIANIEKRLTFRDLLLAAIFTACAVMTKGIFVIVAIYGSLTGQLLFQKRLGNLLKFKWLLLLLLTCIFILPELYALYTQFDLHPEKIVFGRNHVSGIKWFFWDSQFGRFANNGPITRRTSGSVFFYLHTLLWAFAPWCLLFYYALFKIIKKIFDKQALPEYYTSSGGMALLVLFSLSRFQLPFYTNAVFPLFAIITAPFCYTQIGPVGTRLRPAALWLFALILPLTVIVINFFLKPIHDLFFGVDCILFGVTILLIPAFAKEAHKKAFTLTAVTALFAGFYLNTVFYNEIIPYKGQITAAQYINQKPFDSVKIFSLTAENNLFQFYCKKSVGLAPIGKFESFKPGNAAVFFASQQSLDYLTKNHAHFSIIRSFINYPQENILPNFINKATRYTVLDHVYLITR